MEREVLANWIEDGLSLDEIARRVGRHPSTVGYWVRKHGLTASGAARHGARGGLTHEVLAELVARHLTVRQIALEVDRSPTTVRYWLRRHGLRTTDKARRHPAIDGGGLVRIERRCARHGLVTHVVGVSGKSVCVPCRSEAVSRRRRRAKAILVAEAGGRCRCCGYDRSAAALQFHHVDPTTKLFALGTRGLARSIDALRAEAAKCVLVCANCHAEIEAGLRSVA